MLSQCNFMRNFQPKKKKKLSIAYTFSNFGQAKQRTKLLIVI